MRQAQKNDEYQTLINDIDKLSLEFDADHSQTRPPVALSMGPEPANHTEPSGREVTIRYANGGYVTTSPTINAGFTPKTDY